MRRKLEDFLEEAAFELGLEDWGEFQQEELTWEGSSRNDSAKAWM